MISGNDLHFISYYCTMYRLWFVLLLLVLGSAGCFREPSFPEEPSIGFEKIEYKAGTKDSILVRISFQDGDGDLGLNPNELSPPFDQAGPHYFNYLADLYYEKSPGQFEKYIFPSGLPTFYGRFPRLTPQSSDPDKPRPLEGVLIYGYEVSIGLKAVLGNTRIKFILKIKDRALHESNIIETEPILIPSL